MRERLVYTEREGRRSGDGQNRETQEEGRRIAYCERLARGREGWGEGRDKGMEE